MTIASACRTEWITPRSAALLLGISAVTIKRKANLLGIRVRKLPGITGVRLARVDVERVLEKLEHDEAEAVLVAQAKPPDFPPGSCRHSNLPSLKQKQSDTTTARPQEA
jgi:hypothetical protein